MAVTVALIKSFDIGDGQKLIVDITGPASYVFGGEADAPIKALMRVGQLSQVSGSGGGRIISYDAANELIQYHEDQAAASADALDEVPNATNLSAVTIRCECLGR